MVCNVSLFFKEGKTEYILDSVQEIFDTFIPSSKINLSYFSLLSFYEFLMIIEFNLSLDEELESF